MKKIIIIYIYIERERERERVSNWRYSHFMLIYYFNMLLMIVFLILFSI